MDLADLKSQWDENGCLILRGYLSQDELAELDKHTQEYLSTYVPPEKLGKPNPFAGTIKNLNLSDSWFENLLFKGKQVELLKALLEDDLEPASAAFFDRLINESKGIPPHFDAIAHKRQGATMWIALDKADLQNGCLHYDCGSHKLDHPNQLDIEGYDKHAMSVIPIELEPGDAAIHGSRTVHWSEANQSSRSRRAISLFYWAKNSMGEVGVGKFSKKSRVDKNT